MFEISKMDFVLKFGRFIFIEYLLYIGYYVFYLFFNQLFIKLYAVGVVFSFGVIVMNRSEQKYVFCYYEVFGFVGKVDDMKLFE